MQGLYCRQLQKVSQVIFMKYPSQSGLISALKKKLLKVVTLSADLQKEMMDIMQQKCFTA